MYRTSIGLAIALIILVSPMATAVNYYEGFEDETPGFPPEGSFYTDVQQGSVAVTSFESSEGNQSLRFIDLDGGAPNSAFDFSTVGVDLCEGGTFSFAFRVSDATPSGGNRHFFSVYQNSLVGFRHGIQVESDASVTLTYPGAVDSTITGITIAPNTWYNVTYSNYECAAPNEGFAVTFTDQEVSSSVSTGNMGGPWNFFHASIGDSVSITGYVDNIRLTNVNAPPPVLVAPSASSVALTDMVGFDVARDANALAARTDGGANIRAFNPADMTQVGSTEGTQCNGRTEMLSVISEFIAFVSCDGSNDPQQLRIRSPTLTSPNFPDSCESSEVCPENIDIEELLCDDFDPNNFKEIRSLELADWGFSRVVASESGPDRHGLIWGYTTSSGGQYGIDQYTAIHGGCDARVEERRDISSGNDVDQICTWRDATGRNLFAVADAGISPRVHEYVYGTATSGLIGAPYIDGTLTAGTGYSAAIGAKGVACAADRFAFITNERLFVFNATDGVLVKALTFSGGAQTKGITMSQDGNFLAYTKGTEVWIAHTDNLTAVVRHTIPAGTFRGVYLDASAQNSWIGTSTIINRYQIYQLTTIDPICTQVQGCVPPPSSDTTPSAFGFDLLASGIAGFFGVDTAGGKALLGILLIFLGAVIGFILAGGAKRSGKGFRRPGKNAFVGAAFGAALMFTFSGLIGLFPALVMFGTLILVVGLVVLTKYTSSRA